MEFARTTTAHQLRLPVARNSVIARCIPGEAQPIPSTIASTAMLEKLRRLWGSLTGADPASLSRQNLAGIDLGGANMADADLRRSALMGANLSGSVLENADLREADLSGAYLCGARLRRADLRGARLRGADLDWADFRGADLRGTDLTDVSLTGAIFSGARLLAGDLGSSPLDPSQMRAVRVDGLD